MSTLSYEDRLKTLGLPTLAYRRVRGDMIEFFKILSGKYDPEVSDFIKLRQGQSSRGHSLKIHKKYAKLNVKKYAFVNRSTDTWNDLPDFVVQSDTVSTFEKRLYYNYKEEVTPRYAHKDKKYKYDATELTVEALSLQSEECL